MERKNNCATNQIVDKIKEKKELKGLSKELIIDELHSYTKKFKINLEEIKKSDLKIIIKDIRKQLRNLTGQFQIKARTKDINKANLNKVLRSHTSTFERLDFYPKLISFIKEKNPKSILDLGCGLNPLALSLELKDIRYYASDIKEDELDIINNFFINNKIQGKTFYYDLRKINKNLPKADLCLIFKVLDIIAKKEERKKLTEKIIKKINCKAFFISFSTKKLSGRKMNNPKRRWFEYLLKKLNLGYITFSSNNEIFYYFQKP